MAPEIRVQAMSHEMSLPLDFPGPYQRPGCTLGGAAAGIRSRSAALALWMWYLIPWKYFQIFKLLPALCFMNHKLLLIEARHKGHRKGCRSCQLQSCLSPFTGQQLLGDAVVPGRSCCPASAAQSRGANKASVASFIADKSPLTKPAPPSALWKPRHI